MSADPIPVDPSDLPAGQGGVNQAPASVWSDIKDDFLDFVGLDASSSLAHMVGDIEGPTKSYCDSANDPDPACQPLPEQGFMGRAAHWNISSEAEQSFAEIAKRWTDLDTWGVRVSVPAVWKRAKLANGLTEPSIAEKWDAFKVRWINSPDIGELQAANDELHTVEGLARDAGYGAGQPPPPQVVVPSITDGTQTAAAAQAVDTVVTAAQKAVEDKARAAAADAGSGLLGAVPTWLKILLGVGVVTGVAVAVKK